MSLLLVAQVEAIKCHSCERIGKTICGIYSIYVVGKADLLWQSHVQKRVQMPARGFLLFDTMGLILINWVAMTMTGFCRVA